MKILFISHDATLTGAPILLLNLIKCLKNHGYDCSHFIIKNNNGVLVEDFKRNGNVLFFNENLGGNDKGFFGKLKKNIANARRKENRKNIQEWIDNSDVIFSNTITNGDFLKEFYFSENKKVISYVHELEMASKSFTNTIDLDIVIKKTTLFVVPAEAVRNHLINNLGIDSAKIHRLNYFIPFINEKLENEFKQIKNNFIVGIIGTLDWRKGAEILPIIMGDFFRKHPELNLKFLWKGFNKEAIEYDRIIYELKIIGMLDKITFEGPSLSVADFYTSIDVLLLPSKEDPYPLVVLEAASFKKPSICFLQSGGASEFINNDAGSSVPFLNIRELTETIYKYYNERNITAAKGIVAFEQYQKLHNNQLLIAEQFKKIAF